VVLVRRTVQRTLHGVRRHGVLTRASCISSSSSMAPRARVRRRVCWNVV